MNDDHKRRSTRDRGAVEQPGFDPGLTSRTLRTGYKAKRERNEREAREKWHSDVAPPIPHGDLPSERPLWDDDDPVQVGEILIHAGKTVEFKLDEVNQSFELADDLEKIAVPKVRTLVHSVKDLITQTVPGTRGTVSVRSLFRLDRETSKATPALRLRFSYVKGAEGAVAALESRLRALMDLAGSVTDALFSMAAKSLLPNEPVAPQVVELAKQIRAAAPRAPLAPGLEMTSVLFGAPVALPERIGSAAPKDEDAAELVVEAGEVDGYVRTGRLASVLISGRRTSTALAADMEVFLPILQLVSPIFGNICRIWYLQGEDQSGKGKLLRVEIESLGLFAEKPELTFAEAPEFAEAQATKRLSEAAAKAECVTTQSTSSS